MSLLNRMRRQKAIYWECTGKDNFGKPIYAIPVEVACRWDDAHEVYQTNAGDDIVSNAIAYVDRDMVVESVLWLGSMDELVTETDPLRNPGAYQIRRFDKMPNIKATDFLRRAWM